jgi:hypothetical protein
LDVFVEENKEAIVEKARELAQDEGPRAPGETLNSWKQARQVMFDGLDSDAKAKYESQAAAQNKKLDCPPDEKEIYAYVMLCMQCIIIMLINYDIYSNQACLVPKINDALLSLSGRDWGQCGPLVYFVQAAYRNEKDRLKTLRYECSV